MQTHFNFLKTPSHVALKMHVTRAETHCYHGSLVFELVVFKNSIINDQSEVLTLGKSLPEVP